MHSQKQKQWLFFGLFFSILLQGCLFHHHTFRESDFPQNTPEETFEKIKAAVQLDELDWGWNTLSHSTRKRISYTEFSAGWNLYRDEFYRILQAKLVGTEPWEDGHSRGVKLTVESDSESQSFLLVEEKGYWYLEYPSPWKNILPFKTNS